MSQIYFIGVTLYMFKNVHAVTKQVLLSAC